MEKGTAEWYEAMAKAVKKLEHAQKMVERWQATVVEAQGTIDKLATESTIEPETENAIV